MKLIFTSAGMVNSSSLEFIKPKKTITGSFAVTWNTVAPTNTGGGQQGTCCKFAIALSPLSPLGALQDNDCAWPGASSGILMVHVEKISLLSPSILFPEIVLSSILSPVTALSANFGVVTAPSWMSFVPIGPFGHMPMQNPSRSLWRSSIAEVRSDASIP